MELEQLRELEESEFYEYFSNFSEEVVKTSVRTKSVDNPSDNYMYQVWFMGYVETDDDLLEVDDFTFWVATSNDKNMTIELAKALSVAGVIPKSDSDVLMLQVQKVVKDEDGNEECVDVVFECQVK